MRHDNLASKAQASGSSSFDVQMTMSTSTNGSSSSPPSIPANSLPAGYGVYIAQSGDTSQGAASTGGVLRELGQIELRRKDGYGDLFAELKDLNIWEVIGRASMLHLRDIAHQADNLVYLQWSLLLWKQTRMRRRKR